MLHCCSPGNCVIIRRHACNTQWYARIVISIKTCWYAVSEDRTCDLVFYAWLFCIKSFARWNWAWTVKHWINTSADTWETVTSLEGFVLQRHCQMKVCNKKFKLSVQVWRVGFLAYGLQIFWGVINKTGHSSGMPKQREQRVGWLPRARSDASAKGIYSNDFPLGSGEGV